MLAVPAIHPVERPSIVLDRSVLEFKTPIIVDHVFPPTPPAEHDLKAQFSSVTGVSVDAIPFDAEPLVAVIGVGYVGTHLMEVFSAKYETLGFDISQRRIKEVREQYPWNDRVNFTTHADYLSDATHFLISVPTLLLPDKSIDCSYLRSALQTVSAHARPGATIVVESSVAVGMTRELLGPIAKSHNLFVGMSPEVSYINNPRVLMHYPD